MQFTVSLLAMPSQILLLVASVAAGSAHLAPHVVRDLDLVGIPHVRSLEPLSSRSLAIRDTPNVLGTASLATQFNNDVLFSLALNGQISVPGAPNLTATCTSCFTTGTATLQSSGFSQNETLLEDIATAIGDLAKDPLTFLKDVLDVTFALDFQDVAGHFEVDLSFAAAGSISVPLLPPISPLGVSIDGNDIGFIPSIDLVFSVTGAVDATAGFDVKLSNNTSITIDPIKGEIVSMDLTGVQVSPIPLKIASGSGCIQIALRFGLKAGLDIKILGTGANIDAGVFVDAPAYKACANFNSSAPCELGLTQTIFGDAGAFAQIAAKLDFVNFQEGPSVVTTFFSTDLPTACLASSTSTANATVVANVTALQATITAAPFSNNTAIQNATAIQTTVTTLPYSNSTSSSIPKLANTTTTTAALNGSFGTYTITSCKSNVAWCPSNLQTPIVITQIAVITTTTTVTVPHVTMTNPVIFTTMASPIISTISCSGTASISRSTSISMSPAGHTFAQASAAVFSTFAPSIETTPSLTPDTHFILQYAATTSTFVASSPISSLISTPDAGLTQKSETISSAASSPTSTTDTSFAQQSEITASADAASSPSSTLTTISTPDASIAPSAATPETLTTATYVLSSYLTSSTSLASAIASIGGMSSTWSSPLNNGSGISISSNPNGTGIQLTSSARRSKSGEVNFAALCIGLLGLVALL